MDNTGKSASNIAHKITPHLWFDKEAKEAAEFYVAAFGGDSAVTSQTPLSDTPSGDVEVVSFRLLGHEFMSISAGPLFKFNPSISFMVNFDPSQRTDAKPALNALWGKLADGGTALMPLDKYPFSERYGWIQDEYGVSWQLILTNPAGEVRPNIIPSLLFTGGMCGKAEEAMKFYTGIFENSKQGMVARYGPGMAPDKEGTVMFEDYMLRGQWFASMDSAHKHDFSFNEAVSLMVNCDTQAEIDYFWEKLSVVPQAEACGWLKDKFGVSWQVVPSQMGELMGGSAEQRARVTQAFLKMKKFDIAALQRAAAGS
ncbi:VOC family protein [Sideroxydans lithotrophicus]|uniref:3-demethylubiquinone-9 3-methyltransferase n=1 Tax=Sideroxydans lithotrophicus (strain ES-1) TaxID=580332 RepID=D5CLW2_SIDLE|nr:VOC family protein [Sideroxydans lithotrophicus]ADE12557.1 3-demethylubiquinone-9 3-methyltransferase [Sideroxydans lithotrophicus ES-1]